MLYPFHANGRFLYPLKTRVNLWFSNVFRGLKKRARYRMCWKTKNNVIFQVNRVCSPSKLRFLKKSDLHHKFILVIYKYCKKEGTYLVSFDCFRNILIAASILRTCAFGICCWQYCCCWKQFLFICFTSSKDNLWKCCIMLSSSKRAGSVKPGINIKKNNKLLLKSPTQKRDTV